MAHDILWLTQEFFTAVSADPHERVVPIEDFSSAVSFRDDDVIVFQWIL